MSLINKLKHKAKQTASTISSTATSAIDTVADTYDTVVDSITEPMQVDLVITQSHLDLLHSTGECQILSKCGDVIGTLKLKEQ